MKELTWITTNPQGNRPGERWGHSCVIVKEQFYLFGGFANSSYMNDLWLYSQGIWRQLITTGDIPEKRSNATLNYDSTNHQLVLFGGGAGQRSRFNSVYTLDLTSLSWCELKPSTNQRAPFERTYHSAELIFPYLFVFGGESVDDLGDFWIYDFSTLRWRQIAQTPIHPCPRRFQSSCLFENTLYILGGCEGKYISFNDLYAMDLTPLIKHGSIESLKWRLIQLNGQKMERWGHTSYHYEGSIYVFGGRSNEDLNDLLKINPKTGQVIRLSVNSQPQARRRHSGGFIGSCMVIFGGFDGSYFSDLIYINLVGLEQSKDHQEVDLCKYADHNLATLDKKIFPVSKGSIGKYFDTEQEMMCFLGEIQKLYHYGQMESIFDTLNKGYGMLPLERCHRRLLTYQPGENERNKVHRMLQLANIPLYMQNNLASQRVMSLESFDLANFCTRIRDHFQTNSEILLNNQQIYVSQAALCSKSEFFQAFFSSEYRSRPRRVLALSTCTQLHMELIQGFLIWDILILPKTDALNFCIQLAELAEYFALQAMLIICEEYLLERVDYSNFNDLSKVSYRLSMQKLKNKCSLLRLDHLLGVKKSFLLAKEQSALDPRTLQLYKQVKFDLLHRHFKPKYYENSLSEKENIDINKQIEGQGKIKKSSSINNK